MKRTKSFSLSLVLVLIFTATAFSQSKVNERDVVGSWELVVEDLERTKEKYREKEDREEHADMDAGDRFGHAIESAVNTFVSDLLGDAEIKFTFNKDHTGAVYVHIMGENESEDLTWYINDDGALVIKGEDKNDDDEAWYMKRGRLVKIDDDGDVSDDVYLRRVSR